MEWEVNRRLVTATMLNFEGKDIHKRAKQNNSGQERQEKDAQKHRSRTDGKMARL